MLEPHLTPEQDQEVARLAEGLNTHLRDAGARGAEQAFGMGCGLGLLPVAAVVLGLWIFGVLTLIPALVLIVFGMLALVAVSTLIANLARDNTLRRVYEADIEPEIIRFLSAQRISRQLFDNSASRSLPADAPLQVFLSPVLAAGGEPDGSTG